MTGERFVVLGLAHARADWFRHVARWATAASIPVEFVKCVSAAELRARLAAGRPYSAVLIDAGAPGLDRDLVSTVRAAGAAVLVVADGRVVRDWAGLGVSALLPFNLDREDLLDALAQHARPIGRVDVLPVEPTPAAPDGGALVVAVCGPGGTGASTVAIATAQGLASDPRTGGGVLLADWCRHAEQAMLHDAGDVVPGVQELVDAHRAGTPDAAAVRALTFDVVERQYHLLLGLRRARYWPMLRPRAVEAAFASLRRVFAAVVCDTDADFEGEPETGSPEVEHRNVLARTAAAHADVVLAVGLPSMKGLHALARVVRDTVDAGVPPDRVLPVFTRAPRGPRPRAALAATFAALAGTGATPSPVFLPDRRVDDALRDGVRLPDALAKPVAGAALAVAGRAGPRPAAAEPERIRPGSLGAWTEATP